MRIPNPDALRKESYANVPLKEASFPLKEDAPTESTQKEKLALLEGCADLGPPGKFMQATISAGLIEDRSALEWDERVNAWPVEELKECVSTVHQNVARSTRFFIGPRFKNPSGESRTGIGNTGKKKQQRSWLCAVSGGQCDRWSPNRVLIVQDGVPGEPKVVCAHARRQDDVAI